MENKQNISHRALQTETKSEQNKSVKHMEGTIASNLNT